MISADQNFPLVRTASEALALDQWRGFWLLKSAAGGKQSLRVLLLFGDGLVIGKGTDRYGEFAVHGRYNLMSGEVSFDGNCPLHESICRAWTELKCGAWGLWRLSQDGLILKSWPREVADPRGEAA